jgi:hypothetical protein
MIDITKNVFIGQMHLFTKRIQQLMYKDIDELIGECMGKYYTIKGLKGMA